MLKVTDLKAGFAAGRQVLTAVDGISFELAAGETLALLGESGCGKSATALALLRLLPAAGRILGGQVHFDGRDLLQLPEAEMRAVRGSGMAMIFQEPATSLNPVLTVGRQIGEVLEKHRGLDGAAAQARALELLQAVGIADAPRRLGEYPFQLSGGMKQRVMIAVALAGEPRLLIADEPTTALDVTIQAQILDLLRRLQAERGMGMLLITHDLGVVAQMAQRIGVMYAGEIVEEAPRERFFTQPRHPYTQKLFAALPDMTRRGTRLETIVGQVPPLARMPSGCRFAARCPLAVAICHETSPAWVDLGGGQRVRCHLHPALHSPLPIRGEGSPRQRRTGKKHCSRWPISACTSRSGAAFFSARWATSRLLMGYRCNWRAVGRWRWSANPVAEKPPWARVFCNWPGRQVARRSLMAGSSPASLAAPCGRCVGACR